MKTAQIEPFFATPSRPPTAAQHRAGIHQRVRLLAAVLLSAQATDIGREQGHAQVVPGGKHAAGHPRTWASKGLEGYIKTIGPCQSKARHLMETCRIGAQHGGEGCRAREALEALPAWAARRPTWCSTSPSGQPTTVRWTHIFRVS